MNSRTPALTRLLSHLRGLVSLEDTELNRRDLTCARHSEVQLELDLVSPYLTRRWTTDFSRRSVAGHSK